MLSIARLLEKYPKMTDIHVMEGEAVQIRREGRLERITEKMDSETFYAFLAPYVPDMQQGILSGNEALDRGVFRRESAASFSPVPGKRP